MTLDEIKSLPADAIIYGIEGTIKKIWPQKSDTNARGPWSIQKGVLTVEGGEIEFMLKDRDSLPQTAQGRRVKFEAIKNQKGSFSGCYAKDDDYKGNITRIITLTPTGEITYLSGGAAPQNPPAQHQRQQEPPPQDPPPQQRQQSQTTQQNQQPKTPAENPPQRTAAETMREAILAATQIANCQLFCLNMVENYVAPRFKSKNGRELSSEEKHAWSMNMQIELCRNGHQWRMPTVQMKDKPPTPPPTDPHSVQENDFNF